jgi:uncharacterized protein
MTIIDAVREQHRTPVVSLLVDTDVHPMYSVNDLLSRLDEPWRSRVARFGEPSGPTQSAHVNFPRLRNGGVRLDSRVGSAPPGSDLSVVRNQLLDEFEENFAVLIPLMRGEGEPAFQAALCRAVNEWIREEWLDRDPRLRSTLNVPFDAPELAVREIEHFAGDRRFVQVMVPGSARSEWGDQRYWPIYEAAAAASLPVMIHVGGRNNGYRGAGYPSYYTEEHLWLHTTVARLVMSLICSGVFEHVPALQVALIEACISWAGPLQWAMDQTFEQLGDDLPRLKQLPSKYFREHFWFSTQPIEEPDDPEDLLHALQFTGMTDRIMFSSDYPHWDFDSPSRALPISIKGELREQIMGRNACRLYGLEA